MPDLDRDPLLVEVHTTVKRMDQELFGGEGRKGRLPAIEDAQHEHAAKLAKYDGSFTTIVWVLGFVVLAIITVAGTVVAHILGGK